MWQQPSNRHHKGDARWRYWRLQKRLDRWGGARQRRRSNTGRAARLRRTSRRHVRPVDRRPRPHCVERRVRRGFDSGATERGCPAGSIARNPGSHRAFGLSGTPSQARALHWAIPPLSPTTLRLVVRISTRERWQIGARCLFRSDLVVAEVTRASRRETSQTATFDRAIHRVAGLTGARPAGNSVPNPQISALPTSTKPSGS
jgi:hypothetical protein